MKKLLYILIFVPCVLFAQNPKLNDDNQYRLFKHMEVGATLGSTGIGVEIATPINKHLNLRAGIQVLPQISDVATYSMAAVNGTSTDLTMEYKTDHLVKEYLRDMVKDSTIDNRVDMKRQVGFVNGKLLLDWYPFHKKHWHFTAGFFYGSRKIGHAVNTQDESTTMLAMNMYNQMYDQIENLAQYEYPSFQMGKFSFELNPTSGKYIKHAFIYYGRMAVQLGRYPDGTPHCVSPAVNGTLSAEATTNAFKPYIGFGFNKCVGYDKRWNVGFDAGVMFWGKPHIWVDHYDGDMPEGLEDPKNSQDNNHYRVCLVHDVKGVGGIVGKYISFAKNMPLYPVIEVKLAYTIF